MQTFRFPMGSFPDNSLSFESKKIIKFLELYGLFRISVKIVYQDGSTDCFGKLTKFRGSLDLSEDKLIRVDYCAKNYLDYICLRTFNGRIIKAGDAGIDIKSLVFPPYSSIIGFFCKYDRFIYQFGVIIQEDFDLKLAIEVEEQQKREEEEQKAIEIQRKEAIKQENEREEEDNKTKNQLEEVVKEEIKEEEIEEKANKIEENPNISLNDEEIMDENSVEEIIKKRKSKISKEVNKLSTNQNSEQKNLIRKIEQIPKNIKIFLLLTSPHCVIASKFINFLKEACNDRMIRLSNVENYSIETLQDSLEKSVEEFQMSSNVSDPREISIIVIDIIEKNFNPEIIRVADSIVYFAIDDLTCYKNFFKARAKYDYVRLWSSFLWKAHDFIKLLTLKFSENNDKFNGYFVENLTKLTEKDLIKLFGSVYFHENSFPSQINLSLELERLQFLKKKKEKVNIDSKEIAKDMSFNLWARPFCVKLCKELLKSKSLPFPQRQKLRTYYINQLYGEFTTSIEQRNSLTTVIFTQKLDNNKNVGVNLCNFLCIYLEEFRFLYPIASYEAEENTSNIIDEVSFLMDEYFQASDLLNCNRVIEILRETMNNEQLNAQLTETPEFLAICSELLSHPNAFFNIQGQKLLFKALSRKPPQFCIRIWQEELKNTDKTPIARLVINNIVKLCSPFEVLDSLSTLAQKYMILLRKYNIFQIKDLFETSFYNCSFITEDDIQKLFKMILFLFKELQEYDNTTSLLGLLTTFMKFCDKRITEEILQRNKQLLDITDQCLTFYTNNKDYGENFKVSLELFNTLLFALSKFELYTMRNNRKIYKFYQDELPFEIEENPQNNEKIIKTNEEIKEIPQFNQPKWKKGKKEKIEKKGKIERKKKKEEKEEKKPKLVKNLIENQVEKLLEIPKNFMKFKENFKFYDIYDQSKENLNTILKEKDEEISKMNKIILHLNSSLKDKDNSISNLLKENKRFEQEKSELNQKMGKILEENEENLKILSQLKLKVENNPIFSEEKVNFDEDHNELLALEATNALSSEQARIFIENLQKTRKEMKELRSSICGALKFLANDLYSSSTHFFYEIIQNAEDNQYNNDNVDEISCSQPFLNFYLTEDFILICNNEKGFLPKNVTAICKIGQSSKIGGFSIGQKGLGFKSVFSCSDNPHILSNPWSFCFKIEPGQDELQYITPYWVDQMPEKLEGFLTEDTSQTKIYLPFKENLSKERRIDMLKEIFEALDENILLNLSNLKEIWVFDQMNSSNVRVLKEVSDEYLFGDQNLHEKTFLNVVKRKIIVKKQIKSHEEIEINHKKFICYTCEIEIPAYIVTEEKSFKSNQKTRILLGFPTTKEKIARTYPIYAFLPLLKEDHGLKFIVNCDWVLTTNRESIRENEWNVYIRNSLAQFFIWIIFNDEFIREKFAEFLPKELKSVWWMRFSHDILEELNTKENFLKLFKFDNKKEVLLSSETIRNLITLQQIQEILPSVFIIDLKENNINPEIFNKSCKTLSIEQVIACLENDLFYQEKKPFKENHNWWQLFYKILLEELANNANLKEASKKEVIFLQKIKVSAKIFMIANSDFREKIGNKKNLKVFLCKDEQLKKINWRKELLFLDWDSEYEYSFLLNYLQIPKITKEGLFKFIYSLHVNYEKNDQKVQETINNVFWQDLKYIKENFDEFQRIYNSQNLALMIPIRNKTLQRVSSCVFPYILGVSINENYILDENIIEDVFTDSSLDEIIAWEEFFLKIGCQTPTVLSTSLLNDYIFHNFEDLSLHYIEISLKILEDKPIIARLAEEMMITCSDLQSYSLKEVFDINLLKDEFPSIAIPEKCKLLAEKLGITVKSNFLLALKILEILVKKEEKSIDKFQKWLLNLNSNMSEKNIEEFLLNQHYNVPLLYFPLESKVYSSIKDLFISEEKDEEILDFLAYICKKNGKILISIKHNIEYLPFLFLFKKIGASFLIDFEFLNSFIEKLIIDDDMYYEKGNKLSLLSEESLKIYQKSFDLYENLLRNSLKEKKLKKNDEDSEKNWDFRQEVILQINNLKTCDINLKISLPFITHTRTILSPITSISKLRFACLNTEIINDIIDNSEDFVFFEPNFAMKYPRILAMLDVEYLEMNSRISFWSVLNNPIRNFKNLSDKFNQTFDLDPPVYIVKANFASLSLQIGSNSMNYESSTLSKFKLVMRTPFVCTNNLIYLCDANRILFNQNLALKAMSEFLKEFKNFSFKESDLIDLISENRENTEDFWEGHANGLCDSFKTQNVRFPMKDIQILNNYVEIYTEAKPEKIDYEKKPLDNFFRQRLLDNKIDIKNLKITPFFPSSKKEDVLPLQKDKQPIENPSVKIGPFVVNELENHEIGQNAEHFFFLNLDSFYKNHCKPQNWVSSNRMHLFPSFFDNTINDSAGYDFEIFDTLQIFKPYYENKPVQLLFEVKGSKNQWNGSFIMSQNEIKRADETFYDPYVCYYVAIVHNVGNGNIGMAAYFDWKETKSCFKFINDSFKIEWDPSLKNSTYSKTSAENNYNPRAAVQDNYNFRPPAQDNYNYRVPAQDYYKNSRVQAQDNYNYKPQNNYNSRAQNNYNNRAPVQNIYNDKAPARDNCNYKAPAQDNYNYKGREPVKTQVKEYATPIFLNEEIKNEDEFCMMRYLCKMGFKCKNKHTQKEKRFFEFHGVDGIKKKNNNEWKIRLCKIHKDNSDKDEEITCLLAHNEFDSYCMRCKKFGHLEMAVCNQNLKIKQLGENNP